MWWWPGEMLELGPEGPALHTACGEAMGRCGVDVVIGVRGLAGDLVKGAAATGVQTLYVETPAEAGAWLKAHVRAGDAVLLKASRGVRLEGALDVLTGEESLQGSLEASRRGAS